MMATEELAHDGEAAGATTATPGAGVMSADAFRGDRLVFTVAALGSIQIIAMFFTIGRSKAAALMLGPAGVGAISVVDQVVSLAGQAVTLSLPYAATKFLSAAYSEGREKFGRMYASFAWALITTTAAAAVGFPLALWWKPALLGHDLLPYRSLVILGMLTVPATTLFNFYVAALAAVNRAKTSGIYGLLNAAALAVASAAGVLIGGLGGFYVGTLIAAIAVAVGGALFIAMREGASIGAPRWGLPELARHQGVAMFAGSLYVTSLALPAAYLLARFALLKASGFEAAGLLQSAMALATALTLVMRQSNMLLLTPVLNRRSPTHAKLLDAARYLRTFSLTVGAAALPLVLFPDLWLYLLYSRRFLTAAPYTYLFVFAQVLQLFAGVALGLLVGIDRIATQLAITLFGLAVLAISAWWLAPLSGIAGIGVAFVAEAVVVFTLSMTAVWKTCDFGLLSAAGWMPVIVIALIAIIGVAAARYSGFSAPVLVLKGIGGLAACLTVAAVAKAQHQSVTGFATAWAAQAERLS